MAASRWFLNHKRIILIKDYRLLVRQPAEHLLVKQWETIAEDLRMDKKVSV